MPRSRLKTYQRILWPALATMVGELPTKERPFKERLDSPPPSSVTVCCRAPTAYCQCTVPPGLTGTVDGLKRGGGPSSMITYASFEGAPADTTTVPCIS